MNYGHAFLFLVLIYEFLYRTNRTYIKNLYKNSIPKNTEVPRQLAGQLKQYKYNLI